MQKSIADYLGTMAPDTRFPKRFLAEMAKDSGFLGALRCGRCGNYQALDRPVLQMFLGWCHQIYGEGFVFNRLTHYFATSICPLCSEDADATASIVEAA
jgi:hypothetical protein